MKYIKNVISKAFKYTFCHISNLVAKAPSLNLRKKLSNLLSNREALNQWPTFEEKLVLRCNAMTSVYTTRK